MGGQVEVGSCYIYVDGPFSSLPALCRAHRVKLQRTPIFLSSLNWVQGVESFGRLLCRAELRNGGGGRIEVDSGPRALGWRTRYMQP